MPVTTALENSGECKICRHKLDPRTPTPTTATEDIEVDDEDDMAYTSADKATSTAVAVVTITIARGSLRMDPNLMIAEDSSGTSIINRRGDHGRNVVL